MSVLRRILGERFSEVVREWESATVAIMAGGPSFTARQALEVARLHDQKRLKAIAVNDAYLRAPWAEICYFADSGWWAWQTKGIARPALGLSAEQVRGCFAGFQGQKCSICWSGMNVEDDAVHILKNKHGDVHGVGISLDPRALVSGRNSGFQALNLAILAGTRRVLLLGFDGAPDDAGRNHWFGENPSLVQWPVFYEYMRRSFSATEREIQAVGVTVLNCNLDSKIDSFPKVPLVEAFA